MERRMGLAGVAGGMVLAVGAVATQVAQASTTVSDQAWSYPWSSGTSIATSAVWAAAQALLVIGLLGLRRSGAAGSSRAAGAGLWLALAGTALILAGHLGSIPVADQTVDDTGVQLVGGLFGLGTILTAAGLLLAGRATLRAGRWHGWRRLTPLVTGVSALALIGLQFTKVLPTAVAVYALCFVAIGLALSTRSAPAADTDSAMAQVQGA
jgi:hypothetical protein